MLNKNAEGIATAKELLDICTSIKNLDAAIKNLTARASQRGYQTEWNALDTYAVNANGTQGATDGTPTSGHPIVGVDIAAGDLATLLDIAQKYQDCGNNVAVAAVNRINTLLAKTTA
jgi:hypothetical protein